MQTARIRRSLAISVNINKNFVYFFIIGEIEAAKHKLFEGEVCLIIKFIQILQKILKSMCGRKRYGDDHKFRNERAK